MNKAQERFVRAKCDRCGKTTPARQNNTADLFVLEGMGRPLDDQGSFCMTCATSFDRDNWLGWFQVNRPEVFVHSGMTEQEIAAEHIAAKAYAAYGESLHADRVRDFEKLTAINVGDMACEITSMMRREPAINRVGRVLAKTLHGNSTREYDYQIKCLNGEVMNWSNCKMIKVETANDWSSQYTAQVLEVNTPLGNVLHLKIHRHDNAEIVDNWSIIQTIKNEMLGKETIAVEVYPDESNLVDEANYRHLWTLPAGFTLPFGLTRV